jgi:hypothetical protein
MVQINFAQKTVNAKIVYYGPGMSGKTTNLEVVHQRAPDQNRGDLTSISTDGDRTLFFDFMPLDLGTVAGMRTSFQIYTVPGQVYYNSTRKLVLQGVDGVVFVADSGAGMVEENLESLRNLEENLNEYGKSLANLPHVIQFNKRDLPDALSVEDMNAQLNQHACQIFEGVANTGQGVFPTLKALAATVLETIHSGSPGVPAPRPQATPVQAAPAQPVAPAQPMPQVQPQPIAQQPMAPVAPVAAPQPVQPPQPGFPAPGPMPAAAQAQPADPMGQTSFQPQPAQPQPVQVQQQPVQQQQYQQPQYQQPPAQPVAPQPQPVQMVAPVAQPEYVQPQMQAPQVQQPVQQQAVAQQEPAGLKMVAPSEPVQNGAGPLMATEPQPQATAQPSAAVKKSLEQTRFRPRTPRPEPRPTPVGKSAGNKLYTGIFVVLALAVGAVLTRVILSFF